MRVYYAVLLAGVIGFASSVDLLEARALRDDATNVSAAGLVRPNAKAYDTVEDRGHLSNMLDSVKSLVGRAPLSVKLHWKKRDAIRQMMFKKEKKFSNEEEAKAAVQKKAEKLVNAWLKKKNKTDVDYSTFFDTKGFQELWWFLYHVKYDFVKKDMAVYKILLSVNPKFDLMTLGKIADAAKSSKNSLSQARGQDL